MRILTKEVKYSKSKQYADMRLAGKRPAYE